MRSRCLSPSCSRFALLFACIVPMLTGCSRQYVPRVPRAAQCDGDVCAHVVGIRTIEAMRLGTAVTIAVDQAPPGLRLRHAAITPRTLEPCARFAGTAVERVD